ncbi:MAG TPA: oligosaccharide flippase family protein [Bryobacteraceae bacterium]|nr:oligosaccharide flippase family protein [Bryobacteraceae bacterium]
MTVPATIEGRTQPPDRGQRFVRNVLWNWLGTIVSLFIGFILSPYLIAKLGADGYGVWAITFALVEYYWFFDLGFRSATVKFVAHYSATGDRENVRTVISTVFLFSGVAAGVVFSMMAVLSRHIEGFFRVPASLREDFHALLMLITLSWCLGLVFNVFNAGIEAVQCFEYSTKAAIIAATVRAAGGFLALYLGYKLIAIGLVALASQAFGYAANYIYFRRVFPRLGLSFRAVRISTLYTMARFGIHTFVMTVSNQVLSQSPPLLIGHFLSAAFAGFYILPVRLLQYTVELVGRIGIVTNTSAAELAARGDCDGLAELAVYTNRYCLVIFMPLAILLGTCGKPVLALWVGRPFAGQSAAVLPILLAGCVIGVVGQYSASMLLQGLGRHQRYARSLLMEAVAGVLLLLVAIPRWGIVGAAWVAASLMILNRGLVASWLISRTVGISFTHYLQSVYAWPALIALPVFGMACWLRSTALPGANWIQIFALAGALGASYYSLAFCTALERRHRALLLSWIGSRWNQALGVANA